MQQPKKMKLYRYRPLSEVMFKELRYSEIYLASPKELRDPLDMNGRLNFFTDNEKKIRALARFLSGRMFVLLAIAGGIKSARAKAGVELIRSYKLENYISNQFELCKSNVITKSDLFNIVSKFLRDKAAIDDDVMDLLESELFPSLDELFSQFLRNSSVACFTKSCKNFLMWSHYADGHTGICLEFGVNIDSSNASVCSFPLVIYAPNDQEFVEWSQNIKAVNYKNSLSRVDFYDYLPVFRNSGDVDLMNLSKSCWHPYARGIEQIFLEKLEPWREEEEWRIVRVRFRHEMPEERLLRFKEEALTGVYFGANTSKEDELRIRNIFEWKRSKPAFYKCSVDGTREVLVSEWDEAEWDKLG